MSAALGSPRRHFRLVDSTNRVARELAAAGAPHGTLVTAAEQSAGRGRQGRAWSARAGSSLLMSLVIRDPSPILSLVAGVAVAETVEWALASPFSDVAYSISEYSETAPLVRIKWPNDVMVDGRKVAGILVEGRPQEHWAVLGVGLNVAVRADEFPPELRDRAATLGLEPADVEPVLEELLAALERNLRLPDEESLAALAARDHLRGRQISWDTPAGRVAAVAIGIDAGGGLLAQLPDGTTTVLDAGEVHIGSGHQRQGALDDQ